MELDANVQKAFLRVMGAFCFDTIDFQRHVTLTSKFTFLVDDCTEYEYCFDHMINRSEKNEYKSRFVHKETQTEVVMVDRESQTGDSSASNGTNDFDQFLEIKEEQDSIYDDNISYGSDTDSVTKIMPSSPSSLVDEPLKKGKKEIIICPLCPGEFNGKILAEEHLKECHDIGNVYMCTICQDVCMSNAALIQHMKEDHNEEEKVTGRRKTRSRKQEPKKVEKAEKKTKLTIKKEKTKSRVRSKVKAVKPVKKDDVVSGDEVTIELKPSPKIRKIADETFVPESKMSAQVKCAECGKQYRSKRALRRHFSIVHDMNEYQCEICGKHFTGKESLYHHKRGIHMDLKPYKCREVGCDASFNFNHSLRLHCLKHSGSRPHQCSTCGKTYLTAYHLKVHIQAAHSEKKNFSCKSCGKLFSYSTSLKMHEATHEKALRVNCQQCDKSFVNSQALKYHMMSKHSEPGYFPCDECDKVYKSEFLLRTHKRRHTTDGTRFMCDMCGRQFMYKSALEMHKAIHKDEKTFVCKICDKSFKTYPTLYSHQFVHKEDSPYQCEQCGKAFKTKERCKAHEKRHSGLKPFECQVCHHCFPDNGGLSKHMRTVHCTVKKFVCDICGKATSRADNLRVHMKVHSKGDYKPKQVNTRDNKIFNHDLPSMVPLTFDQGNGAFVVKKDKDIEDDLFHGNSRDSMNSSSALHGDRNHFNAPEVYQPNMPHFATIDSSQLSSHSEDQNLPLNLQSHPSTSPSSFQLSHIDSTNNVSVATVPVISTSLPTTSVHSSEPTSSISVTSLQPHYMYTWPYMYPPGIQPQPGSSSGFFQQ